MVLGSEGSVSPSEPHHRNGESRTNCAGLLALMSRGWYGGGGESGLQGLLIGRKALESCTNILQRRKPPVWRPLGGKDKWRKSTGLPSRTSKFSLISVTWELGCREAGTEPSGLGPRFLVRTQRDAHFTGRLTWDSAAEMFCARRT